MESKETLLGERKLIQFGLYSEKPMAEFGLDERG